MASSILVVTLSVLAIIVVRPSAIVVKFAWFGLRRWQSMDGGKYLLVQSPGINNLNSGAGQY